MEKTRLWPCPLDEKNLCTDWIEEMFGDGGWMETPACQNGTYVYLTYVGEVLVKVMWRFGNNQLSFIVIHDEQVSAEYLEKRAKKAIDVVIGKMSDMEKDNNDLQDECSQIAVRYNEDKNRVDFFFYWDHD